MKNIAWDMLSKKLRSNIGGEVSRLVLLIDVKGFALEGYAVRPDGTRVEQKSIGISRHLVLLLTKKNADHFDELHKVSAEILYLENLCTFVSYGKKDGNNLRKEEVTPL